MSRSERNGWACKPDARKVELVLWHEKGVWQDSLRVRHADQSFVLSRARNPLCPEKLGLAVPRPPPEFGKKGRGEPWSQAVDRAVELAGRRHVAAPLAWTSIAMPAMTRQQAAASARRCPVCLSSPSSSTPQASATATPTPCMMG